MTPLDPSPVQAATTSFAELALPEDLLAVIAELGFHAMTPIQAQAVPALLAGRDLIGQAKTGSGKTMAFSLPILAKVRLDGRRLQALVLCPTRELCAQVAREIRRLGRRLPGLQVLPLAGGQPLRSQYGALEKGVHIVVGTPGRVLDHLRRGTLNLQDLRHVVLDEADRMLDMGFQDDMEAIFAKAPPDRQTVFFSATFPDAMLTMSSALQKRPLRISVGQATDDQAKIRQIVYPAGLADKPAVLRRVLQEHAPKAALVFCNFKAGAAELAAALNAEGISADALHGDLEQVERDRVLAKFRNQSIRVLVATDVAARGIDIADLDLVCNVDLPAKAETYVHRIGRTGRAGKTGLAVSLITPRDEAKIAAIEALTGSPVERGQFTDRSAPTKSSTALNSAAMVTLYISGGRKDKVRPGDILGALTGEAAGLAGVDIGKIEIHDHFAYVAVRAHLAEAAIGGLREGRIKGRKFQVERVR